ncbi:MULTISPECIES: BON domain-containing protein [unclassified Caballeronia]|uniref:BON domain-containing protein n=1 Tax=unclassified Caballeronia TaxID=2646786 RepID=UPI0028586824|nr:MULTISPECIES: BON domain-containing protein [unclassified Caballeronia]MDR5817259.1 BON domain-containing protein [Caballeronia sp. LZ033]MDR5824170.1 BON domain-containing protein [Caballeronia sp. LZ043]MDR5882064.1 BON domain-containing protein [Caballeronia sp. LZ032]
MRTRMLNLTVAAAASFMFIFTVTLPRATAAEASPDSTAATSKKAIRAENRALGRSVRHSLTQAKGLDSSHINVLARGSTVTLEGSVPDQSQIDTAQAAAAKVAGVQRVDNRLTIYEPGN